MQTASSSSSSGSGGGGANGVAAAGTTAAAVTSISPPSLAMPEVTAESTSLVLSSSERALFAAHSIASLKQLAEDKRNQSDDKKEELRQLVGIRYRVLIETADSIDAMHTIVHDCKKQYEEVQDSLPQMSLGSTNAGDLATADARPSQLQLLLMLRSYSLAPVSIWSFLDAHDFESAISLYLAMQDVATRLAQVEHWPLDSQADHPNLKGLIDTALQAHSTAAAPSLTLAGALSSFFHHHASYYLELPALIAYTASQRLQHRSLAPKSYADCVAALAMVSRVDARHGLGAHLLDQFLESKRKQIHDLVWSAEHALESFQAIAPSSTDAPPSPTPILAHACQHVLFTLQYAVLDVAFLFGSIHASANPHASLLSQSNNLVAAWKETHVAERVAAIQARARGTAAPLVASTTPAAFTMDSSALGARMAAWLAEIQFFIARALSERLLPFLLPSSTRARSPCASFATLRSAILRAANWEDARSAQREEELEERAAAPVDQEADEDSKDHAPSRRDAKHVLTPAEQGKITRKRMQERWNEACTILFGRGVGGGPSGLAMPLSLFDLLFFEPLRAFSNTLVARAFDRLTLASRVERYLRPRAAVVVQAAETKKLLIPQTSSSSLLDQDQEEPAEEVQPAAPVPVSSITSPPASELHGAREDEVQEIVDSFQRQLRKLGRECGAILECVYVQASPAAGKAPIDNMATPLLFPSLQRYLQEELTPLLTKKYSQLIERLVDQLKLKLTDLEKSVLQSMSDVTSWRSSTTQHLVEQSVFIGRVCHALVKEKHLMSLDALLHQGVARSSTLPTNPVHHALANTAKTAFRIWTRYIAAIISEDFVEELAQWTQTQVMVEAQGASFSQLYCKQALSNRSHNGAAALGLFLPVHASPSISQLLFQVHHHYYRSFGYHIQSDILAWLLLDIDQALLSVFEKKVLKGVSATSGEQGEAILDTLPNHAVLQLMFDMQFLFALLRLPPSATAAVAGAKTGLQLDVLSPQHAGSSDPRARYAKLLAAFETHLSTALDQIDWMTSKASFFFNLQAAVQRASMLYAVLSKTNPFPPTLPQPTGTIVTPGAVNGFDAPAAQPLAPLPTNILALAPVAAKILPLPASLYPTKRPQPVVVTPLTPKVAVTSTFSSSSSFSTHGAAHAAAPAAAASTGALSVGGLSFSNLGSNFSSQLALANTSAAVNAKAIGDLGSTLLGKLSSNALWGGGGTKKQ